MLPHPVPRAQSPTSLQFSSALTGKLKPTGDTEFHSTPQQQQPQLNHSTSTGKLRAHFVDSPQSIPEDSPSNMVNAKLLLLIDKEKSWRDHSASDHAYSSDYSRTSANASDRSLLPADVNHASPAQGYHQQLPIKDQSSELMKLQVLCRGQRRRIDEMTAQLASTRAEWQQQVQILQAQLKTKEDDSANIVWRIYF